MTSKHKCVCLDEHDRKNVYIVTVYWADEYKQTTHRVLAFNPDEAMGFWRVTGPNSRILEVKKVSGPFCQAHED